MTTKIRTSFLYGSVISAGLALLPFSTAFADSTGTLDVTAEVVATCDVGSAILDFGEYNPGDSNPTEESTSFSVECTTGTNVFISLNSTANNDGDQRRMTDGDGNYLKYRLYQEDGATLFGDGTSLGQRKEITVSPSTPELVTVNGEIEEDQTVPTGQYDDHVVISLAFL